MRFKGEKKDLETVRIMGLKWGFGNCIQYLSYAWADYLLKEWQLDPESAALAAGLSKEEAILYKKNGSKWIFEGGD